MSKNNFSNVNARIVTGQLKTDQGFRTRTSGRDQGCMNVSVVTRGTGGTTCKIFTNNWFVDLNGYEARTLYRALSKHYNQK